MFIPERLRGLFIFSLQQMHGGPAAFAAEQDALVNLHRHVAAGHGLEQLGLQGLAAMGA